MHAWIYLKTFYCNIKVFYITETEGPTDII